MSKNFEKIEELVNELIVCVQQNEHYEGSSPGHIQDANNAEQALLNAIKELFEENERLRKNKKPWVSFEDRMPDPVMSIGKEFFVCGLNEEDKSKKVVFRTKFDTKHSKKDEEIYRKELISYGWTHWKEIDEPEPPED